MTPAQATDEVFRRVEEVTGKPVVVTPDPSLKVIATSRAAGVDAPAHVVRYLPSAQVTADYLICFQCGFVLRTALTDAADRFDIGPARRGREEVDRLLRDHGRRPGATPIAEEIKDTVRDQLYDGIVRQLRSVPVGLRVDAWLSDEYPALAEQQRALAGRQLGENVGSLSPGIRKLVPEKVVRSSAAMSAAFACYWGRATGDPTQVSPYRAAGFLSLGEELLSVFDDTPPEPTHDRLLIEGWADRLRLADWFEFVPQRD